MRDDSLAHRRPADPTDRQVAQTSASPQVGIPTAVNSDSSDEARVGAAADTGTFTQLTIAELLQLALVLPEGAESGAVVTPDPTEAGDSPDLTDLSLLELMTIRVSTEAAPVLPELAPEAGENMLLNETRGWTRVSPVTCRPTGA
jgi:hypothetical protein